MNLSEACKLLNVTPSDSTDDIKKAYKLSQAKYHPDVYKKDDGATFKKVTEAYNLINKHKESESMPDFNFSMEDVFNMADQVFSKNENNPFATRNNPFNIHNNVYFSKSKDDAAFANKVVPIIKLVVNLTLEEFVCGCSKKITYERLKFDNTKEKIRSTIKVPKFITQQMLFKGKGHAVNKTFNSDVVVSFDLVDPRYRIVKDMVDDGAGHTRLVNSLEFRNTISLRDAVLGAVVENNIGDKTCLIEVPPMSRHGDRIIFDPKSVGIEFFENLIMILDIEYPENIKEIV